MSDYKTIAESNNFIVLEKYTKEWKIAESYQSEGDWLEDDEFEVLDSIAEAKENNSLALGCFISEKSL